MQKKMIFSILRHKLSQCYINTRTLNGYSCAFNYAFYSRRRFSKICNPSLDNSKNKPYRLCSPLLNSCLHQSNVKLTGSIIRSSSYHSWQEAYISVFRSLSESTPVVFTQNTLIQLHDLSGLPWWATIVVTTFLFRVAVTAPLALYQQYILAKVENLKQELPEIAKQLQIEVAVASKAYNWSKKKANRVYYSTMKKQWSLLIERDNCHPVKSAILVCVQLPGWICISMSIRNLVNKRPFHDEAAEVIHHQFKNEGLLWIPDLTIPDTTFIIPVMICLVTFSIIELQVLSQVGEPSKFQKIISHISRFFALLTLVFSSLVSSSLSFYWLTSASIGLCQNLTLMSPKVKLLAGIPKTPTTLSNPYRHVLQQFEARLQKLRLRKSPE